MGLLPNDSFLKLSEEAENRAADLTTPPPPLTEEEQTKKYGGPVGSEAYYLYKSGEVPDVGPSQTSQSTAPTARVIPRGFVREVGSALGIHLPESEVFDRMGRVEQIGRVGGATATALVHLALAFPKEIVKGILRTGYTTYRGWQAPFTGKPVTEEKSPEIPLLGAIPSMYRTYEDAKASGMGPLAAGLQAGSMTLADATIFAAVGETFASAFRPRRPLKPGEMMQNTAPIQAVIEETEGILRAKRGADSPSEYYSIPQTQAQKYGGHSGNTFVKLTPASPDGTLVELSIVQTKKGPVDRINTFFGINKNVTAGKYGSEQKIYSQVVEMEKVPEFLGAVQALPETVVVPEAGTQIAPIPPAPLKGRANKPIDGDEIRNLATIGKVNGLERDLQVGVIKALTGKDTVSELTHAEYVNVAQTISRLNGASKFAPEATGFGTWVQSYVSPTRYWTRNVEERTGLPVHQAHNRIETGARLAKISEQTARGELYSHPVIEKYSAAKYAEERRLVRAYREGDTGAIDNNPSLSPEVKAELKEAAGIFDEFYAKVGPDVNVPVDIFIENYSPHISDIGGKFQLYKEEGLIPGQASFFAKQKRTGSLSPLIDDEWALADIYARAGYKAKYYDPIFKDINLWIDQAPRHIRKRFASYVQEKLGYAGEFEKGLDAVATSLNNRFGLNLPPDTARVLTNQAMNTMYSSAMSQPATWVRNAFQYPTMGYAYWGPKFMPDAIKTANTKAGMKEFLDSGFSVDLGVPFGEELAQTALPGKINNAYRTGTQSILKPNSVVENYNRASMYFQTKFIFEDTIARYNSGKITWQQVETELGLPRMNKIDANEIRKALVEGDMKGAFESLARSAIDDTQFPYRRGESMKLSYGMAGHIGTAFMQWPVEYTHTLTKWVATGQVDRVVRLLGSTSVIIRTFRDQFGIDFSSSFATLEGANPLESLTRPIVGLTSPFLQGGAPATKFIFESQQALYDWVSQNEEDLQKHQDELMRQARLAIPGGLQGQNMLNFYKAWEAGPNEEGLYAVKNSNGTLNYYAPFKDVFWGAMGFPATEKVANRELQREMSGDKFDYTRAKRRVVELFQDGMALEEAKGPGAGAKYIEEATAIIEEYANKGLDVSPDERSFDKYYIPATERTYQALPDGLKAKFAPRVFK